MASNVKERLSKLTRQQQKDNESEMEQKNNESWKDEKYDAEKFKSENWNKMDESEREKALQGFENHLAEEQGRDARELHFGSAPENSQSKDGNYFDFQKNEEHIDENLVKDGANQFSAMDAVAHEGRHATQYDELTKDEPTGQYTKDQSDRLKETAQIGEKSYSEYDANAYANDKMTSEKMENDFGNDPAYQEYKSQQGQVTGQNKESWKSMDKSDYMHGRTDNDYDQKFSYNSKEKEQSESQIQIKSFENEM